MLTSLAESIASDPGSFSQWGAGGAALLLLTISIGLIGRQLRNLNQENKVCNYRLGVLGEVLRMHKIFPPKEFWDGPPELTDRKRRKLRLNLTEDEEGGVTPIWLGYFMLAVIFVVGLALIQYVFVIHPIQDLRSGQATSAEQAQIDRCANSLTADYFVAIQRALAAPPAPNPERDAAVKDLGATAERIRRRVQICEDGHADKFKPTPATTPATVTTK